MIPSSYVSFLKKNGIRNPQGYRTYEYEGTNIPENPSPVSIYNDSLYAFDIGDEEAVNIAVENVMFDLHKRSYLGVVPSVGEPYGIAIPKRGTEAYYRQHIAPCIEMVKDVSEKLDMLGYVPVFFTLTTDTKLFASQTSAWIEHKKNVNRILSWARKGSSGRRKRVYHLKDGSTREFTNPRPKVILFFRVPEDTEARYPAPHILFLFSRDELLFSPLSRDLALSLFNDELTCISGNLGFTKVSFPKGSYPDMELAVDYITKYLGKQMNPVHPKYNPNRSITWMVCLRSVGCRMYSMSNKWNVLYQKIHSDSGSGDLNYTISNSNVVKNCCYFFNEPFHNLMDFMGFFKDFYPKEPPPLVVHPRDFVTIMPVPGFTQMMMVLSDDYVEEEVVTYLFPHCKECKHFSKCPRVSCSSSVKCVHCCCSEADIVAEFGACFLAKKVFGSDGFLGD